MKTFDGFKKSGIDNDVELLLEEHISKYNINNIDILKLFPVLARRQWLKRFLAHNELFKMTLEIPGDIAELGVFRGLGLMTWANLLETYCIGDRTKVVWGFDNWKGFTKFNDEDGLEIVNANKVLGGFNPENFFNELNDAIEIFNSDRFVPWKDRVKLVCGQIEETVYQFIRENPGVRFSLIHFDCDLYKPTKAALDALWPLVTRGGVVIFDEYAIHDWPGETKAVDEFISENPTLQLKTFSWTNAPAAYLIKK
jgi:hypothetical protein